MNSLRFVLLFLPHHHSLHIFWGRWGGIFTDACTHARPISALLLAERLHLLNPQPLPQNTLVVYMYPVEPNLCEFTAIANASLQEYMGNWNTTCCHWILPPACNSSARPPSPPPSSSSPLSFLCSFCTHAARSPGSGDAITLSQRVFTVQTAADCVGAGHGEQSHVCGARLLLLQPPVKHVRKQGSFKSDWFTAFIAL